MDDPREEPLYEMILGKVLWGEPREEVFHRLNVNGLTGERAEAIYAAAWEERLVVIRRECARKAGTGLLLTVGAVVIFCVFWFGLGVILNVVLYLCAAMFFMGAWKAIDGFAGMLMAGRKEGSVADDA
ncbi:hypothetical protein [Luteolibacter soli]|uniref:DUF2335 domain-containing protein n=1 Tax=Luteolibacter soli TaxID=3135280 RepID=A0ABU9AXY5_9BACT